jgi:hypothetical protein
VFSGTVDRNEVFIAARAVVRYRMLMLGFERIRIWRRRSTSRRRGGGGLGTLDAQRALSPRRSSGRAQGDRPHGRGADDRCARAALIDAWWRPRR